MSDDGAGYRASVGPSGPVVIGPLTPVDELFLQALDAAGVRQCPECGREMQPRLGEIEVRPGQFKPAAVWTCREMTFHMERTEPLVFEEVDRG